jgi:DNA-binding transcriptional ArsR family regulator
MREIDDASLLTALKHPVRRKILRAMVGNDRISPREISDELGMPVSNVGYHVRVLADCGAIMLVEVAPVRGTLQHFYRMEVSEPWALTVLGLTDANHDKDGD